MFVLHTKGLYWNSCRDWMWTANLLAVSRKREIALARDDPSRLWKYSTSRNLAGGLPEEKKDRFRFARFAHVSCLLWQQFVINLIYPNINHKKFENQFTGQSILGNAIMLAFCWHEVGMWSFDWRSCSISAYLSIIWLQINFIQFDGTLWWGWQKCWTVTIDDRRTFVFLFILLHILH